MKIVLDTEACVGHGRCYALAPLVFAPDDIGHCAVLLVEPGSDLEEQARIAVASCPEDALRLEQ